jgi:general secretion pathway protein G
MQKSTRAFTLIELLVVIAIIGLLATIIMVGLGSSKAKSRDAKRQADIKNIQLALSMYYNDNGMYPRNIYAGAGAPPLNGLAPTYLPVVPTDPGGSGACTTSSGSNCYKYVAYGTGANCNGTTNPPTSYHLGAKQEDTSNPGVTNQDVDADTGGTYTYSGVACTLGVPGAFAFNGNAVDCAPSVPAAVPDACYDVAP